MNFWIIMNWEIKGLKKEELTLLKFYIECYSNYNIFLYP